MSTWLADPAAIYAESFATIRREADLTHLPSPLHAVAIRMIHACGFVALAADIAGDAAVVPAIEAALGRAAPILVDSGMVKAGIIPRHLSGSPVITGLDDSAVGERARALATTRSAAAVDLWRDRLAGAIVVIGNAPTALFRLLDMLDGGGPQPAAIIATPVGFVGAAESKARLAEGRHGVPFLTVRGRLGGSAIAAAALNAIAIGRVSP